MPIEQTPFQKVFRDVSRGRRLSLETDLYPFATTDQEKQILQVGLKSFERAKRINNRIIRQHAGQEVEFLLGLTLLQDGHTTQEVEQILEKPIEITQSDGSKKEMSIREALKQHVRFENVPQGETGEPSGILVLHADGVGRNIISQMGVVKSEFNGLHSATQYKDSVDKTRYVVIPAEDPKNWRDDVFSHELMHMVWSATRKIRLRHARRTVNSNPLRENPEWFDLAKNELLAYLVKGDLHPEVSAYVYDDNYSLKKVPADIQEKTQDLIRYIKTFFGQNPIQHASLFALLTAETFTDLRNAFTFSSEILPSAITRFATDIFVFTPEELESYKIFLNGEFKKLLVAVNYFSTTQELQPKIIELLATYVQGRLENFWWSEDWRTRTLNVFKEFCDSLQIPFSQVEEAIRPYEEAHEKIVTERRKQWQEKEDERKRIEAEKKEQKRLSKPPTDAKDLQERYIRKQLPKKMLALPFPEVKRIYVEQAIAKSQKGKREYQAYTPQGFAEHLLAIPEPYDKLIDLFPEKCPPHFGIMLHVIIMPFFQPSFAKELYDVTITPEYNTFLKNFFENLLSDTSFSPEDRAYIRSTISYEINSAKGSFERRLMYHMKDDIRRKDGVYRRTADITLPKDQAEKAKQQARQRKEELLELIGM